MSNGQLIGAQIARRLREFADSLDPPDASTPSAQPAVGDVAGAREWWAYVDEHGCLEDSCPVATEEADEFREAYPEAILLREALPSPWRDGPPTEAGWYWLDNNGYLDDAPVPVVEIDSDGFPVVQSGACQVHCRGIKRHCPIPRPPTPTSPPGQPADRPADDVWELAEQLLGQLKPFKRDKNISIIATALAAANERASAAVVSLCNRDKRDDSDEELPLTIPAIAALLSLRIDEAQARKRADSAESALGELMEAMQDGIDFDTAQANERADAAEALIPAMLAKMEDSRNESMQALMAAEKRADAFEARCRELEGQAGAMREAINDALRFRTGSGGINPDILWKAAKDLSTAGSDLLARLERAERERQEAIEQSVQLVNEQRQFLADQIAARERELALAKACRKGLHVIEKGIEVRMMDQWPILADILPEAKALMRDALAATAPAQHKEPTDER